MRPFVLFPSLLALLTLAACNAETTTPRENERVVEEERGPENDVVPDERIVRISLSPSSVALKSIDGAQVQQPFHVLGHKTDGSTVPILARVGFSNAPIAIGQIGRVSGEFKAHGLIGGTTIVRAEYLGLTATATAVVSIERNVPAPAELPALFADPIADTNRSAQIAYPLNGAVMPQNIVPADIQWNRGNAGDVFRIRLTKPNASVVAYVRHVGTGFQNSWLVLESAWRSIAQSDGDAPCVIAVDRYDVATRQAILDTAPVSIRFAQAALQGTVYYWDVKATQIMRVDDGNTDAKRVLPNLPTCVGCHAISPSGRKMLGRLDGDGLNSGVVFDLAKDLTASPPPMTYPRSVAPLWWFSTWSPDEKRIFGAIGPNGIAMQFGLFDPDTGRPVPYTGALPTQGTHPAWSPDGTAIAYAHEVTDWAASGAGGDIALIPVTGSDSFGTRTIIHRGTGFNGVPSGRTDSSPTWTPDSRRIAFAHGNCASSASCSAALYMVDRDGANVVRLTQASGGPTTGNSFQPHFSPFDQGGYQWLTFLSRRNYGNALRGTAGKNVPQVWVTAIKKNAAPGEDPSEVGYWLPGQATGSKSISAYWAKKPCLGQGEQCGVGSECCSNDCSPNADGTASVCSPPPVEECLPTGNACSVQSDCCAGLDCGVGAEGRLECVPACTGAGSSCADSSECCGGLSCIEGVCDRNV